MRATRRRRRNPEPAPFDWKRATPDELIDAAETGVLTTDDVEAFRQEMLAVRDDCYKEVSERWRTSVERLLALPEASSKSTLRAALEAVEDAGRPSANTQCLVVRGVSLDLAHAIVKSNTLLNQLDDIVAGISGHTDALYDTLSRVASSEYVRAIEAARAEFDALFWNNRLARSVAQVLDLRLDEEDLSTLNRELYNSRSDLFRISFFNTVSELPSPGTIEDGWWVLWSTPLTAIDAVVDPVQINEYGIAPDWYMSIVSEIEDRPPKSVDLIVQRASAGTTPEPTSDWSWSASFAHDDPLHKPFTVHVVLPKWLVMSTHLDNLRDLVGELFAERPEERYDTAQERVTDTSAFKRWFGESTVVDKLGRPMIVFHGTNKGGFTKFSKERIDPHHIGFFFTDSRRMALTYTHADPGEDPTPDHTVEVAAMHFKGVYEVYLSIQNPLVVDADGAKWNAIEFDVQREGERRKERVNTDKLSYIAKEAGYDGVIIKRVRDSGGMKDYEAPGTVYIAFYPSQIKSAHKNVGTFDPANEDIRRNPRRRRRT